MTAAAWRDARLVVFDTETTGVDVESDRIVTATVAGVGGGREPKVTTWLVDPGVDIPDEAAAIHGVTTERARAEGRPPAEVCSEVEDMLGRAWLAGLPVVAYNAAFDLTVLDRECRRHLGGPLHVGGPVVDPYVIDRAVDPYRKGRRTLSAVCEHHRVALAGAHDATQDALAAGRLAWRMAAAEVVALMTLEELHAWQVTQHAARQSSFADYLRRKGEDPSEVSGEWPMRAWRGEGGT